MSIDFSYGGKKSCKTLGCRCHKKGEEKMTFGQVACMSGSSIILNKTLGFNCEHIMESPFCRKSPQR